MFTIKLKDGFRTRILEAESFTILYQESVGEKSIANCLTATEAEKNRTRYWAEVTLHNRGDDVRYDVGDSPMRDGSGDIQVYQCAYIENAVGKTVESINYTSHLRDLLRA